MSLLLSTGAFASSLSGAAPGMVLMLPTSIAHSGTSATLGANGQVTFTGVTSLSLNGVFTADFDNYVISWRGTWLAGSGGIYLLVRMRASGTDDTGTNYITQELRANSTTISGFRSAALQHALLGGVNSSSQSGNTIDVYGPNLAQPTAFRAINIEGSNIITDHAATHSQSISYDGFTIDTSSGGYGVTGALQVYGVRS